jgi:hypothetical protein
MYGARFTSTIQGPEQADDWRQTWRIGLDGIKAEQIKAALVVCTQRHEWPPSPAEFRALCVPPINHEKMFIDAANALSTGNWPNPITYWAAQSFGAYDLRTMSYKYAKDRWVKAVNTLAAEHTLPSIPEPKPALPAPGKTMSPEVAKKSIEEVRLAMTSSNLDRRWACRPRSQSAVDLMFRDPQMTDEIEVARQNGYIVGASWVSPEKRKPATTT